MHGEDVIGWVGVYIQLLGRAFRKIDSHAIEMEDQFYFSSQLPEVKLNHSLALKKHVLEAICQKHDYSLAFKTVGQWQITINQCPGLILQIKCHLNSIKYGYRASHVLACDPPHKENCGLTTMALLHLNHILREARYLE